MRPDERLSVSVTAFIHGLVHGNLLAIPVFLDRAWRSEFAVDDVTLGVLAAVAYACFGLGSIPFGYLSDRWGSPPLLLACVTGIAGSLFALAWSPGIAGLALSLASLGLFSGIYHPAGLSLLSRALRDPGRGMGWHGMGGSLGIAAGPAAVGGLLQLGLPWRYAAAVLAAPALVAIVLLLRGGLRDDVLDGPPERLVPSSRALLQGTFIPILLVYTFAGIAYWGSLTFLPRVVGTESYVLLLGLGALGQVLAGYIADRPRFDRWLLALSLGAAGVLVALGSPGVRGFTALSWAYGFLLFSLEPLQNSLVTGAVPARLRGLAFGMTFVSVFGLGSMGAVLAGLLLSRGASAPLFVILGASLATSGAFVYVAGRGIRAQRGT